MSDTPTSMSGQPAKVSQKDIEDLAAKLDGLELSYDQMIFLSGIIDMAAKVVKHEVPDRPFRDHFATAFTPESATYIASRAQPPHIGNIKRP